VTPRGKTAVLLKVGLPTVASNGVRSHKMGKGVTLSVDGLFIKKNVDLYITGSNAQLLSGELATLLTGRYIEISILPFSYSEYSTAVLEKSPNLTKEDILANFICLKIWSIWNCSDAIGMSTLEKREILRWILLQLTRKGIFLTIR
jgi:predicted AAA+ superfamily ATPase